jgi:anion-transporting  ArsA/GET3 family ATPase
MRVLGRGSSVVFGVLKRVTGLDLIQDLSEFFTAMSGMVGGFRERAKKVNELLADDQTSFLVVCGPAGEPINEAVYFHRKLIESELPFGGVIVNKVHTEGRGVPLTNLRPALEDALGDEGLAERVSSNYDDYRALAERDARNISLLAEELGSATVIEVPYLSEDVHDLAGLFEVNSYLFDDAGPR